MEAASTSNGGLSILAPRSSRDAPSECQYDHQYMEELIRATNNVANKVDQVNTSIESLNKTNDNIVRYLVIVICVIALGRSLIEAVQSAWSGTRGTHIEASK